MERQPVIVICGPYVALGHTILSRLAEGLRALDFPVHLCSEFPPKPPNDPQAIQETSYAWMKLAKAYLLVFLSPLSLGPKASKRDLIGGTAFESGILYANWKDEEDVHIAFLFDGYEHRSRLSKMLQKNWMGSNLEAVVQSPGDMIELYELAAQLCAVLADAFL